MAAYAQLQMQQFELAAALGGSGGSNSIMFPRMVVQPAVFGEPERELTCKLSGSRMRARDEPPSQMPPSSIALHLQQKQPLQQQLLLRNPIYCKTTHAVASDLPVESSHCALSAMTSTSGRPPLAVAAANTSPVTPLRNNRKSDGSAGCSSSSTSSGLISMLHCSSLEVDALVRLHADKLRSGLDEARKSQCHAVIEAMGRQVRRRIADKQVELDGAAKRNVELEERLREATAESQSWFNVAKNSEALVSHLRTSLEQALLQNHSDRGNSNRGNCAPGVDLLSAAAEEEEGYGDSEEEAGAAAVSCSVRCSEASYSVVGVAKNAVSAGERSCFPCKSCGEPDARVLVLPCRHLGLCASCECPVCRGRKNASIQISFF